MTSHTSDIENAVLGRLRDRQGELTPKRIEVREDLDSLENPAWRLLLVLPAPTGASWDQDEVFALRRMAIEVFDELVGEREEDLPGVTVAQVTTDEADAQDIASEDPSDEDDEAHGMTVGSAGRLTEPR